MKLSSLKLRMALSVLLILTANVASAKQYLWSVPFHEVAYIAESMMEDYEVSPPGKGDNYISIVQTFGSKFHFISDNTHYTEHQKLQKMRKVYKENLTSKEVAEVLKPIFEGTDIDHSFFTDGRHIDIIHNGNSWTIYKFTPRSL